VIAMPRPITTIVCSKVEQLGDVLSELLALYRDPANAAAFARKEAALSTMLTKHQLLCTALRCTTDQSPTSRKEAPRPA
jgi:hypothetical protein